MSLASRTKFVHCAGMKDPESVQFKLMIPAPLKVRMEEKAAHNRRSLSQEIIVALEEKYPPMRPEAVRDPAAKILFWLADRIRRRNPRPGSARDRQAALYEGLASDIISRMETIENTSTKKE